MDAQMSLYDYAKQVIVNEVPMDAFTLNRKVKEISDMMIKGKYWMLLCRERNDYSIFATNGNTNTKIISRELLPTLQNRGLVLVIDKQPGDAYEIWIRDSETKDNFAYYLFNYENGVIDCNE